MAGGGFQFMPAAGGSNGATAMAGNALRLSDTEKAAIRQKMAKMVSLLPKLDLLLNDEDNRRPPLTSQMHRQIQTIVRDAECPRGEGTTNSSSN